MYVNLVPKDCRSRIISHIKRDKQLIRFISSATPEFTNPNNRVDNLNSMERSFDNNA